MKSLALFTDGLRTPFAAAGKGAYKDVRPDDLLTELMQEQKNIFLKNYGENSLSHLTDVIVGCAYPEGEQGYNIARVSSLGAAFNVPGATVNRLCGSSLEAVSIATAKINSGWGDLFFVGGIESMSRVPRRGANFSESEKIKSIASQTYIQMGETAELLSQKFQISRTEQEDYSYASHEKADRGYKNGFFNDQLFRFVCQQDEGVRATLNKEKVRSLPPAFREGGTVTAATSSPLSDGASSGWVMSEGFAKEIGVKDGLMIRDVVVASVRPEEMGMGPVPATQTLLKRNQLSVRDIDAFEMNEAFSVQALACQKKLEINDEKLNVYGGAIAIGHPLGASGLRLMMTLQSRFREIGKNSSKNSSLGVVTLCVGGGQGVSILCEYRKYKT
jgi:acetyl-CoA acyltransferase